MIDDQEGFLTCAIFKLGYIDAHDIQAAYRSRERPCFRIGAPPGQTAW